MREEIPKLEFEFKGLKDLRISDIGGLEIDGLSL
jgi:hypothetical protein